MQVVCINFSRPDQAMVQWSADGSIESWTYFYERFSPHFTTQKRHHVTVIALSVIIKGKKERKWSYINRFAQVVIEVEGVE